MAKENCWEEPEQKKTGIRRWSSRREWKRSRKARRRVGKWRRRRRRRWGCWWKRRKKRKREERAVFMRMWWWPVALDAGCWCRWCTPPKQKMTRVAGRPLARLVLISFIFFFFRILSFLFFFFFFFFFFFSGSSGSSSPVFVVGFLVSIRFGFSLLLLLLLLLITWSSRSALLRCHSDRYGSADFVFDRSDRRYKRRTAPHSPTFLFILLTFFFFLLKLKFFLSFLFGPCVPRSNDRIERIVAKRRSFFIHSISFHSAMNEASFSSVRLRAKRIPITFFSTKTTQQIYFTTICLESNEPWLD